MNAADKAKAILVEGRLTIEAIGPQGIVARCRGFSGEPEYVCGWLPGHGWHCTCKGRTFGRECAHIKSLHLVTVRPRVHEAVA